MFCLFQKIPKCRDADYFVVNKLQMVSMPAMILATAEVMLNDTSVGLNPQPL